MELNLNNVSILVENRVIIENFSYLFSSGNVYLLYGKNGIGKTSLLKFISSLCAFEKGELTFEGQIVKTRKQLQEYRKRVSLFSKSESCLFPNLTLLQNIHFFLSLNDIDYKKVKKDVNNFLRIFDLDEHKDKVIYKLSKGMKQKAALIITFLKGKDIILLDEPFEGLDTDSINVLRDLIEANRNGKITIITSPNHIDRVCTEVIELGR